ncbi:hypothetical protein WT98_30465 [Burkholderia territorii]|nr:hypothetical protein WT98_30465 [Burkholderia territorii]
MTNIVASRGGRRRDFQFRLGRHLDLAASLCGLHANIERHAGFHAASVDFASHLDRHVVELRED